MPLRSVPNTIEALRLTLLKLEQSGDQTTDSAHFAQLKGILLNRIAELEAANALASSSVETSLTADPAGLPATAALPTKEEISAVTDSDLKVAS